jgi:pimeloyl-ACP methyl ester carboxylesterase
MTQTRIRDIDMYYEEHGDPNGEPVLLIMGFLMNAAAWGAQVPALKRQYRVIAFDNRGAGRTSQPDAAYTMPQLADDAVGLLDHLRIDSAHVIGASLGGMIAQELTLRHPQRVRSLVLCCTSPGGPQSAGYERLRERGSEIFGVDDVAPLRTPERLRDYALELFTPGFLANPGAGLMQMAGSTAQFPSTLPGMKGQMAAILSHDTYDRLSGIAAPTLVLHGEDDPMIDAANARALAERIPNAELRVFPGLRHGFNAERPDEVNAAILEFLARHARVVA